MSAVSAEAKSNELHEVFFKNSLHYHTIVSAYFFPKKKQKKNSAHM